MVAHLLAVHKPAASIDDGSGRLPIHHAAGRKASPQNLSLLSTLIEAYPEVRDSHSLPLEPKGARLVWRT